MNIKNTIVSLFACLSIGLAGGCGPVNYNFRTGGCVAHDRTSTVSIGFDMGQGWNDLANLKVLSVRYGMDSAVISPAPIMQASVSPRGRVTMMLEMAPNEERATWRISYKNDDLFAAEMIFPFCEQ